MKRSAPLQRRESLRTRTDAAREFERRGRASSARTMGRSRPVSPASPEQRAKVRDRLCANCGGSGPCDPAHLAPRAHGGCDHPDCVIPLCRACHRSFDDRDGTRIDLEPVLALPDFAAERAHMASHMSLRRCIQRLTGRRLIDAPKEET